MTPAELVDRCRYWQQVLKLQDWDVEVHLKRARDMGAGVQGEVHVAAPKRIATIHILDATDYDPLSMRPQDMERDLVHELVHLTLWDLNITSDPEHHTSIAEERAIEALASGLVRLDRGRRECEL